MPFNFSQGYAHTQNFKGRKKKLKSKKKKKKTACVPSQKMYVYEI